MREKHSTLLFLLLCSYIHVFDGIEEAPYTRDSSLEKVFTLLIFTSVIGGAHGEHLICEEKWR